MQERDKQFVNDGHPHHEKCQARHRHYGDQKQKQGHREQCKRPEKHRQHSNHNPRLASARLKLDVRTHAIELLQPSLQRGKEASEVAAQLISYSKGDGAQPFFEKAAAEAASRGQMLLCARFRLDQYLNAIYGEHPQGAIIHCQEAYDVFMAAGNTLLTADALRAMGDRRGTKRDADGARELYLRALAPLTPLGEHGKTGMVLNNMAIGYENQGQISQAQRLFQQAAETWTECGDLLHAGVAIGNLADISMERGQLREAEEQYANARKQIEITDSPGVSYEPYSIAVVRLYQGDITGAQRYTEQAVAMPRHMKDTSDIGRASETMGAIRIAADDLAGARESFQQAMDILHQRGSKSGVAEAEAALAGVSIEEGNFSETEQALRKSLVESRAESAVLDEVPAETDLARALLHQGKLADARQMISDALALSASSRDPALKLPVAIQGARIEAAELVSHSANLNFASTRPPHVCISPSLHSNRVSMA